MIKVSKLWASLRGTSIFPRKETIICIWPPDISKLWSMTIGTAEIAPVRFGVVRLRLSYSLVATWELTKVDSIFRTRQIWAFWFMDFMITIALCLTIHIVPCHAEPPFCCVVPFCIRKPYKNKSPISHFEKQGLRWSDHNPSRVQLFKSTYNTFKIENMLNH